MDPVNVKKNISFKQFASNFKLSARNDVGRKQSIIWKGGGELPIPPLPTIRNKREGGGG